MNFCDATDVHFEITISSSFHNPGKVWTLTNYFHDKPKPKEWLTWMAEFEAKRTLETWDLGQH